jgi:hypothetical protein
MNSRKQISVFIASPGDLAPERQIFKETIDKLNSGFADGAGITFVSLGWQDLKAQTGRRTQSVINQEILKSDVFILALHRRWGQKAPDSQFSSYTEEEFYLALSLWKKKKSPEVMVFFKNVDSAFLSDPGSELKKVLAFRRKLEDGRAILIRNFNTEVDFGNEIDGHLRAFARGDWDALRAEPPEIKLSRAQIEDLIRADRKSRRRVASVERRQPKGDSHSREVIAAARADLSLVKAFQADLALARDAVAASREGRIQDASILFAKATQGTTDLSILSLAEEFFRRIKDLDSASALAQRRVAIADDRRIAADYYIALLPQDHVSNILEQTATQMLAQFPEEIREEIRSMLNEIYGNGRYENMVREILIRHYTEGELMHLNRFLASPEGQSSLYKQPLINEEAMERGKREFIELLKKRHPELAIDAEPPEVEISGSALPSPVESTPGSGRDDQGMSPGSDPAAGHPDHSPAPRPVR